MASSSKQQQLTTSQLITPAAALARLSASGTSASGSVMGRKGTDDRNSIATAASASHAFVTIEGRRFALVPL